MTEEVYLVRRERLVQLLALEGDTMDLSAIQSHFPGYVNRIDVECFPEEIEVHLVRLKCGEWIIEYRHPETQDILMSIDSTASEFKITLALLRAISSRSFAGQ